MTFSYHRKLGPLVGMVLALACAETVVVHIVALAYWGRAVAVVLGLLDLSLIVMLALLIRSFRTNPISLSDGVLTLRTGRKLRIAVSVEDISGFRDSWSAEDVKRPTVFNMALIAWPTVMMDLKQPLQRRGKIIRSIAHCADDPATLQKAVLETMQGRDRVAT